MCHSFHSSIKILGLQNNLLIAAALLQLPRRVDNDSRQHQVATALQTHGKTYACDNKLMEKRLGNDDSSTLHARMPFKRENINYSSRK